MFQINILCPIAFCNIPRNKGTLTNSWAATPFKFQWQKVKDDRLKPGLISMSPQKYNKILIYSKKVSQHLPVEECLSRNEM